MASTTGADLVARVRNFHEFASLQHETIPNVAETLECIRNFLWQHETPSASDSTHEFLDNYLEWWSGKKSTCKLAIAEDNTVELLNTYIDELYKLDVPLTLGEKKTPEFKFVQHLCIWGTQSETVGVEELFGSNASFADILAQAVGDIYPYCKDLNLVVFDATGLSRRGDMNTSLRLVWPDLVVNKERALRIHDYVVYKLNSTSDKKISALYQRATILSKENRWGNIFNSEIYQDRHCIRMPLCDGVSPAPMKGPERRPLAPSGVFRYHYKDGSLQSSELVVKEDEELARCEWMKMGSIRCDVGTPLTDWMPPKLIGTGKLSSACCAAAGVAAAPTPLGARFSSKANVRTHGGSPTMQKGCRGPRVVVSKEQPDITLERVFDGTIQDFSECLVKKLGSSCCAGQDGQGLLQQDMQQLTWQLFGDASACVTFRASNQKVYITGKKHQVRSVLPAISSFTRAVGQSAYPFTQIASSQNVISQSCCRKSVSLVPSAVYAPSAAFAVSNSGFTPSQAHSSAAIEDSSLRQFQPSRRLVIRDFNPQSTGELKLVLNQYVTITDDPYEDGQRNAHRWVFGRNEATNATGLFPASHVSEEVVSPASASVATNATRLFPASHVSEEVVSPASAIVGPRS